MSIAENLIKTKERLPENIKLVAVTKTQSTEIIMEAYHAGHKIFGENKVQELTDKYQKLPEDIEWHMIGHLQTNKVKFIAPFVSMIHSIDSLKLLRVIDHEAKKAGRRIPCLLQVRIAKEETKFGLTEDLLNELIRQYQKEVFDHVVIGGVMGMATFTEDSSQIRSEFKILNSVFHSLRNQYFTNSPEFREISMGMSSDYAIAVEEGSTIVRIGSSIFGERN